MAFAAWIPAIASIGAALINTMGTKNTNDTNLEIQQQNSAFNAEQAQLNRNFQAEQVQQQMAFQQQNADTVWQRGVRDMQAAGLNPMLAYSQGGNPTAVGSAAGGSTASAGQPGNMQNPFAAAGNAAVQWAQIENIQAQTEKTKAEAEVTKSQMREWDSAEGDWKKPTSWPAAAEQQRARQLWYAGSKLIEEVTLTQKQEKLVNEQINNAIATNSNIKADTRDMTANAVLKELAKAESENRQAFQLKYPGYNRDVAPFLRDANSITNSAANISRIRR